MSQTTHDPLSDAMGDYPRPQLVREDWQSLDGAWAFAFDDADAGLRERWYEPGGSAFDREITVPFPPESRASGIGDTGFHPVVWYRRSIALTARPGHRVLLHFGAVDHDAEVWVDGRHVGGHRGGYTAFSLDVTDALEGAAGDGIHELVVRAYDDPNDPRLPRGKQDWQLEPHVVWYHRSTGIWRTVWLEEVPAQHLVELHWHVDLAHALVVLEAELAAEPAPETTVTVALEHDGAALGEASATASTRHVSVTVPVPAIENGQAREALLWFPDHPVLIGARIVVDGGPAAAAAGSPPDRVSSYLGLRSVGTGAGRFLLNGRPQPVRAVLEQGYWPDSLFTAPDVAALRAEVELVLALGFNAARVHQKIEDPRFLYWADRLGVMLWAEQPSAYRFSPEGAAAITAEWLEAVRQQRNHPSVVTWVPLNESWGVQDIASEPAQQAFARALADATRALDLSRPVISNDGWEHQNSDIVGIHDYEGEPAVFAQHYADTTARDTMLSGFGPAHRRMFVGDARYTGQPVMVTEFGGVGFQPDAPRSDGWGYTEAVDESGWLARVSGLYDGIRASGFLAGSCYTQLTDTLQETNGLCTADRRPKAPIERIRAAVRGDDAG